MTTSCDICGRGMDRKMILPVYFPYEYVCERAKCREAVRDAVDAIHHARDEYGELAGAIAKRHEEPHAAIGYRTDVFAEIQFEDDAWWAMEVAKENV